MGCDSRRYVADSPAPPLPNALVCFLSCHLTSSPPSPSPPALFQLRAHFHTFSLQKKITSCLLLLSSFILIKASAASACISSLAFAAVLQFDLLLRAAGVWLLWVEKRRHCPARAAGLHLLSLPVLSSGGRVKTWKRRWFILTDNCLYYFEYTTVSASLRDCAVEAA